MKSRHYVVAILVLGVLSTHAVRADGNQSKENAAAIQRIRIPKLGHDANAPPRPVIAPTGQSINGTGMVRPGSSTGAIGGNKANSSGVGGPNVHAKHP
jgi:hypothetical protein